jgi:hypothetical protein
MDRIKGHFESTVRQLLSWSAPDSIPIVVVLETFIGELGFSPVPHEHGHTEYRMALEETAEIDYAPIYRSVAEHYKAPIWSFREAMWSNHVAKHQKALYDLYVKLGSRSHPVWHQHLLTADVFASVLVSRLEQCNTSNALYFRNSSSSMQISRLYPAPSVEPQQCDAAKPLLLHIAASTSFKPADVKLHENESRGWSEYIDRRVPGWIINKNSPEEQRVLTFPVSPIHFLL